MRRRTRPSSPRRSRAPIATTSSCAPRPPRACATRRSCSSRSRSTTSAAPPTCCCPPTRRAAGATASSPSNARPTSPTTPRARSSRRSTLWNRLARPNVMIKVPATDGRDPGDRGAHRPRGQRQHHAAVLRRALRAGDRRLHRRPRATRQRRAANRRHRLGRLVLRLAHRRQGRRRAAGRLAAARTRRDRQRPARLRPVPDRFSDERWLAVRAPAPSLSDRCGRAPAPRTPPTPTSSTSRS